jgi:hypothetical protein
MPRKKLASAQEFQEVKYQEVLGYRDALLKPGARKVLRGNMQRLVADFDECKRLLEFLGSHTRSEIRTVLTPDERLIARACRGVRIRVDDLQRLARLNRERADFLSGKRVTPPEGADLADLLRFLSRLANPVQPKARTLKAEFIEAFNYREEGQSSGKVVTAAELAKKFMRNAYNKNQESTIRSMQAGLRRVERERKRKRSKG